MKTKSWAMLMVLISTFVTSSGQIFLKKGAMGLSVDLFDIILNFPLLIGCVFYAVGAVMLIVSLKYGELSVLYPIYALNFIWVSILSPWFYVTDSMNMAKWFGVIVIMAGVSLVGIGSKEVGK